MECEYCGCWVEAGPRCLNCLAPLPAAVLHGGAAGQPQRPEQLENVAFFSALERWNRRRSTFFIVGGIWGMFIPALLLVFVLFSGSIDSAVAVLGTTFIVLWLLSPALSLLMGIKIRRRGAVAKGLAVAAFVVMVLWFFFSLAVMGQLGPLGILIFCVVPTGFVAAGHWMSKRPPRP